MIEGITQNIAWYFFLAGAGSGAFMVHALMGLVAPERQPRLTVASHASSPALAPAASACLVLAGSLFLLADLGVPELFPLAINRLGASVISFGALAITIFVVLASAYAAAVARSSARASAAFEAPLKWAAFAAALATASYTGYYLFSMSAIEFWGSPLVILLLLASSLSTGSAVLMLLVFLRHPARRAARLRALCRADSAIILAEAVLLAAFATSRLLAGGDSAALALEMMAGGHAPLFWAGAVGLGLVAPAVLERVLARGPSSGVLAIAIAASVLAGGLALRCSIILV